MPWGIAAGIVPKYAFSENREFQTFYQYFAFHISLSLCRIGQLISLQFERIFRYWFCIRFMLLKLLIMLFLLMIPWERDFVLDTVTSAT